jgi:hypothetical protein
MHREPAWGNDAKSAILPRLHLEGGSAAFARDQADIERMAGTRYTGCGKLERQCVEGEARVVRKMGKTTRSWPPSGVRSLRG